jgi:hypothetical protein
MIIQNASKILAVISELEKEVEKERKKRLHDKKKKKKKKDQQTIENKKAS